MKHLGDITKIDGAAIEPVNVIIGGSPCQDLSVAGKGAGLAGERSGLFMDQIRIVKEMRRADEAHGRSGAMVRPRFMVWENVPGALSSNKGEDFGAVLQEIVKVVNEEVPSVPMPAKGWSTSGCLMGMDGEWSIAWRVFDNQFWGTPQRRRRIALVADFGGATAPEILFEREGVHGDHQPRERSWKEIAGDLGKGSFRASGENGKVLAVDARNAVLNEVNNTLQSNAAHSLNGNNVVMYSLDRAAFNQGKNARYDFDVRDDGIVSTLVSKGPSAICFRKGTHPRSKDDPQRWEQASVVDTLNSFDRGETRTPTLVVGIGTHCNQVSNAIVKQICGATGTTQDEFIVLTKEGNTE